MNDGSDPVKTVLQAQQDPTQLSPRIYKHTQQSNPPETPTSPSNGTTIFDTRAPVPVSLYERHQAALHHIHSLETQNAKLYQDNCRLVNAVNMLNDRLAFLGASQRPQIHFLADLQEKLRTSETNRTVISQKYQELMRSVSAGSVHQHVGVELQSLREAYASLDSEYRLLGDKYIRLKAVVDTNRTTPVRGLLPVVRSEFPNGTQLRPNNQPRNDPALPTSVIFPDSSRTPLDHPGNRVRLTSEGVIPQPLPRPSTTLVASTWLAPLPTPSPSIPPPGAHIFPTGLPIHASVPAGSLPFPHHAQAVRDLRTSAESSAAALPPSPIEQDTLVQPNATFRCDEILDMTNNEPVPFDKPMSSAPLESSHRPPKRPNTEPQTSTNPVVETKKPRTEVHHPATTDVDECSESKSLPLLAPAAPSEDRKASVPDSDVRSYRDCVDVIFEKDANVENGVFCGLCFDRYEAKMIQEPPDILVQPDFGFLVTHCMTMHPTVWEDLHRKA